MSSRDAVLVQDLPLEAVVEADSSPTKTPEMDTLPGDTHELLAVAGMLKAGDNAEVSLNKLGLLGSESSNEMVQLAGGLIGIGEVGDLKLRFWHGIDEGLFGFKLIGVLRSNQKLVPLLTCQRVGSNQYRIWGYGIDKFGFGRLVVPPNLSHGKTGSNGVAQLHPIVNRFITDAVEHKESLQIEICNPGNEHRPNRLLSCREGRCSTVVPYTEGESPLYVEVQSPLPNPGNQGVPFFVDISPDFVRDGSENGRFQSLVRTLIAASRDWDNPIHMRYLSPRGVDTERLICDPVASRISFECAHLVDARDLARWLSFRPELRHEFVPRFPYPNIDSGDDPRHPTSVFADGLIAIGKGMVWERQRIYQWIQNPPEGVDIVQLAERYWMKHYLPRSRLGQLV